MLSEVVSINFSVILTWLEMLLALLASAVAWPEAPTACERPRVLGFAAIKILCLEGEGLRFSTLLTSMLSLRGANHRVEEVTKLHGFRFSRA